MKDTPKVKAKAFISPLAEEIECFLRCKRAAGCRYFSEEPELRVFDRFLALHLSPTEPVITLHLVRAFLARKGEESETTRAHRLSLVRELCRFLALEEPRTEIPPRRFLGIRPRPFVQRVLTRSEGKLFLDVCSSLPPGHCSPLRGMVHGILLTLLFLTGLRLGEALRLTRKDVDLSQGLLHVRESKFGKSRLVPVAPDLAERLRQCAGIVEKHLGARPDDVPFFPGPKGDPVSRAVLRASFREVLVRAGITGKGNARRPRLHDLRGTFAVLRLLLWYQQDVDLDAKLPVLATYLGHVGLASTQRYLQLTTDLFGEVTRRHQDRFGHLIED